MKRFNNIILLVCCLLISLSVSAQLTRNHWAEKAYQSLNNMIQTCGVHGNQYDANCKPYAVFDFDNTTSINDIEETLMAYQISHLCYKIKPAEMYSVITLNLPVDQPLTDFNNELGGRKMTIRMLATDVANDYAYLYRHYIGLGGMETLDEVQNTPQFLDFRCKMRYMYDAMNYTFPDELTYTWILYAFKGMTTDEVRNLTSRSADYWMHESHFDTQRWESPDMGKAGKISVTFMTGLAITDEVKNLYHTLMDNGIEVYICSASLKEVIEAAATFEKYGLNLDRNHVVGMMMKRDANNRFTTVYDTVYPMTYKEGKVVAIKNYIASKHQNHGPILVCGDSDGDYNMLTEFPDMKCGLVFNRVSSGKISLLCHKAIEEKDTKYVLQGRDENTGVLRNSESSVLLGKNTEELFHK